MVRLVLLLTTVALGTVMSSVPAVAQAPISAQPQPAVTKQPTKPPAPMITLDMSAGLTRATTDAASWGIDGFFNALTSHDQQMQPSQRTRVRLNATYDEKQKSEGPLIVTRTYFGSAQQLYFLGDGNKYLAANAALFSNSSLGLDLEQLYRPTFGMIFDPNDAVSSEWELGLAWYREDFSGSQASVDITGFSLGTQTSIGLPWLVKKSELSANARAIVPFKDVEQDWQLSSQVFLRLPFNDHIGLTLALYDDYLANAPPTSEKNYLSTTASFSLKFGV